MNIYLLRHAIAKKRNIIKYPNDDRPLTAAGSNKMHKIAKGIAKICPQADLILSSPLKRTLQTTAILKKYVRCKKIITSEKLLPGSSLSKKIDLIKKNKSRKSIFLIGHEPGLSELMAKLISDKTGAIEFKKGGLALIMLGSKNKYSLSDFLSPKVLIRLGSKAA